MFQVIDYRLPHFLLFASRLFLLEIKQGAYSFFSPSRQGVYMKPVN